MGSYCSIKFDNLSIFDSKSYVPDNWAVLFQESDRQDDFRRHEDADPDDPPGRYVAYVTSRDIFLQRLALLGATDAAMRYAFEAWLSQQREDWQRYAREWNGEMEERAREHAEGFAGLDFDGWKKFAAEALVRRYDFANPYEPQDGIERTFYDYNETSLSFAGYGDLLTIRALLEACPDIEQVKLDVSDLIDNGYYAECQPISEDARRNLPLTTQPLGPTIILGEGGTDLRVLEHALVSMHPHLVGFFSFFSHSEFSVDGGAFYLVKFLKAFAAARMSARMIAIFDNDAAGSQAAAQALALRLPPNFIVMKLPDTELARSYPTIGPSGPATLDVNGTAGGIELYLGRKALTVAGTLRPVRWTGYVATLNKYQGEVDGKADVLAAYLRDIAEATSLEEARATFPELAQVWEEIVAAVERNAGDQYLQRYEQLMRDQL